MLLGREVLDQQVLDAEERPMGKVDGVVLEWHPRAATRVVAVVVGGTTLLWRIHRRLAAWAERRPGGEGRRTVLPWRKVLHVGVDVKVDVEAGREIRLERLLGRMLVDATGLPVGPIEDVDAQPDGDFYVVTHVLVGHAGRFERLRELEAPSHPKVAAPAIMSR